MKDSTDRVYTWILNSKYTRALTLKKCVRKDSTDRQSLITQALFQEAQRDRIRAADRDGKHEIVYLQANATARDALQVRRCTCGPERASVGVQAGKRERW